MGQLVAQDRLAILRRIARRKDDITPPTKGRQLLGGDNDGCPLHLAHLLGRTLQPMNRAPHAKGCQRHAPHHDDHGEEEQRSHHLLPGDPIIRKRCYYLLHREFIEDRHRLGSGHHLDDRHPTHGQQEGHHHGR